MVAADAPVHSSKRTLASASTRAGRDDCDCSPTTRPMRRKFCRDSNHLADCPWLRRRRNSLRIPDGAKHKHTCQGQDCRADRARARRNWPLVNGRDKMLAPRAATERFAVLGLRVGIIIAFVEKPGCRVNGECPRPVQYSGSGGLKQRYSVTIRWINSAFDSPECPASHPRKRRKRRSYPWSLAASSTFGGRVRGDGPGERGCGSLWFLILAADG